MRPGTTTDFSSGTMKGSGISGFEYGVVDGGVPVRSIERRELITRINIPI